MKKIQEIKSKIFELNILADQKGSEVKIEQDRIAQVDDLINELRKKIERLKKIKDALDDLEYERRTLLYNYEDQICELQDKVYELSHD